MLPSESLAQQQAYNNPAAYYIERTTLINTATLEAILSQIEEPKDIAVQTPDGMYVTITDVFVEENTLYLVFQDKIAFELI